ncbi:MAG TPA: hypothetical protein VF074_03465 [Pyrinomonadaceae bacterium]
MSVKQMSDTLQLVVESMSTQATMTSSVDHLYDKLKLIGQLLEEFQLARPSPTWTRKLKHDPRSHTKLHEKGLCFVKLRMNSWIVR